MILILLGPPGVGKGTQSARIAVHYDVPTISTGVMFRDAMARGTDLGRAITQYKIEKGEFVPDAIVIAAVLERTAQPDCVKGFLLDGFPRTIPQADALNVTLTERKLCLDAVLDFVAPIDEIVGRFSGRRVCPVDGSTYHITNQPPIQPGLCDVCGTKLVRRPDDDPTVVQRRLEVYNELTAPLRDYYRQRGLLRTIDANADPESVFSAVVSVLNAG